MIYREEERDLFSVPYDYFLAQCISADFEMGKGIAVQFNQQFDMKNKLKGKYQGYLEEYIEEKRGGDCILEGQVLNLVTKERYYYKPTIKTMKTALKRMKEICLREHITKVAMPTIGAGLDRLSWFAVSTQIQQIFIDTDIEILVCKLNKVGAIK